jgi:glycosyltransferase involved in cell wall biosynthesis
MPPHPNPLVSVVLPTYNRADLLRRAIDSVLRQRFSDFELIVVDDASRDDTWDLVKSISDSRLQILRHVQNRGAAAARNTGIAASRGEFIAFQDSDDEWLPEKLGQQLKLIRSLPEKVGLIYSSFIRVNGQHHQIVPSRFRQMLSRLPLPAWNLSGSMVSALSKGNFITTSAVMVRKTWLESSGHFDESLPRLQDWDLWLRMAQCCLFSFIRTPLLFHHATPENISSDSSALLKAFEIILTKSKDQNKDWRWIYAQSRFARGDLLAQSGRLHEARHEISNALAADVSNPVYWISTAAILVGIEPYKRLSTALGIGYKG